MTEKLELIKIRVLAYLKTAEEKKKEIHNDDNHEYYLGGGKACEFLIDNIVKNGSLTTLESEISELLVALEDQLDTNKEVNYYYCRGCEYIYETVLNDIKSL